MASISTNSKNGCRTVQFVGTDSKRRSVRLGKVDKRTAEGVKRRVERLVEFQKTGESVDAESTLWLRSIGDDLHTKLVAAQLASPRVADSLGPFIEQHIAGKLAVKPRTIAKLRTTEKELVKVFGTDKLLREFKPSDADQFRATLLGRGLLENTVRKHLSIAKQFFRAAIRAKLIETNPFEGLASTVIPNRSRQQFVTRSEIDAVMDQCPDAEWRLIIGLSRYGGLRCPSEHFELRWSDVDFHKQKIAVRSPKTEHHVGHDRRTIPIFPELMPLLRDAYAEQSPNSEFVIETYRRQTNLRTRMIKFVERAGLKPWPKIFHQLRSSRQTELQDKFPTHTVCAWLGNSARIAADHYLQVTDEHFERAVKQGGAESGAVVSQNAVQHVQARNRTERRDRPQTLRKQEVLPVGAKSCNPTREEKIAVEGLEPTTLGL